MRADMSRVIVERPRRGGIARRGRLSLGSHLYEHWLVHIDVIVDDHVSLPSMQTIQSSDHLPFATAVNPVTVKAPTRGCVPAVPPAPGQLGLKGFHLE